MWFRKKIVLIPLAVALLLAGSITGVALAQDENAESGNTLLARVASILGIDQTKLEDAFAQAQNEIRNEALSDYLDQMVTEGKITQEEANKYKAWWDTRPDTLNNVDPGFGFGGRGGRLGPGCGMRMAPFLSTQSSSNTQ